MTVDKTRIEQWINDDPSEVDQQKLRDLLAAASQSGPEAEAAAAELENAFAGELTFGTAGLRGKIGAGPNRMNRAVVIRAAAGLAAFLKESVGEDFEVVVGYDARHGSSQFALDTCAVITAAGGKAKLFPRALPTPVTAYALRYLGVDAAVMVTASHNPPQDNGYKVYLGGRAVTGPGQGAQIVPPYDGEILAKIQAAPAANQVPMAESGWEMVPESLIESYIAQAVSLASPGPKDLRIVLTSMHGVGGEPCLQALNIAGFKDVHIVAEQHEPDPDFPTVSFPNPEEPGALDLAMELARKVDADIVLANDPDADRCSAAIPDASVEGGWRQLTGDEIGSLLGEQSASFWEENSKQREADGMNMFGPGETGTLACSIVSSRLLSQIAKAHGMNFEPTLTGFKWISRAHNLVFGYEEAIGFCVDPQHVRDKDGISASLRLASLAQSMKAAGRSLDDLLNDLAYQHGLYATSQLAVRVTDLSLIADAMKTLRTKGLPDLDGSKVVESVDLAEGYQGLPPTDGMLFLSADNSRVIARPSGTEPKLKCYLEVVQPVAEGEAKEARVEAQKRLEAIKTQLREYLGFN
ncbi:phospho-sugar mutase [Boudabousia marimammalium]|uniref:Phosphomannomutase n=1 Tax=Boudabousia marimammalium TaxID=156892 RepID=A0A1Q5PSA5_9ACTO|nr:phospho-sugar mutase [Boudabousia marimammalium]OKL50325.1 phosphomannomutase [Boudabousia marimammalium]